MGILIQLAATLAICASLAYLSHRRGFTVGFLDGLTTGRAEKQQLEYHKGHEDGLYEGRLRTKLEAETTIRKAQLSYEQGWNDCRAAIAGETHTALLQEAETHLSA